MYEVATPEQSHYNYMFTFLHAGQSRQNAKNSLRPIVYIYASHHAVSFITTSVEAVTVSVPLVLQSAVSMRCLCLSDVLRLL